MHVCMKDEFKVLMNVIGTQRVILALREGLITN